jgi:hypothetical protein
MDYGVFKGSEGERCLEGLEQPGALFLDWYARRKA